MGFDVIRIRRRIPLKPQPKRDDPGKPGPLPESDLIDRLAALARMARTLRGVGRFGPEAFTEDKSDLVRACERLETDVRRRGVRKS